MDRDNFTAKTKRNLGDRVGYRCSCPTCRRLTIGPTKDISAPLLIAEAAHISAACEGGPRFNQNLTAEERKAVENGIWLCATCHTMVDKDREHFTDDLLREWKNAAEDSARREVEGELIFSGYSDPRKCAEQHFKAQFQEFVAAHADMGRGPQTPLTAEARRTPIVWVQMVSAASLKGLVNLTPAQMKGHLDQIQPAVCSSSWGTEVSRFGVNVSGYGSMGPGSDRCLQSLVQLFKDGSIAIGFVLFASDPESLGYDFSKSKAIPWMALEDRVIGSIRQGVRVLKGLHVPQVAYARLIIPGVKGYGFVFDPSNWIQYTPADTDTVVTGESMIANFDLPPTEIARPLLEGFWQHFGVWHSPSYNDNGEFVRKRH
ncbi:MAG: HNH endonuclease [Verrucomicrobiota bacterium]